MTGEMHSFMVKNKIKPLDLKGEIQKLDRNELRKAIVLSEILGKPKTIRKR